MVDTSIAQLRNSPILHGPSPLHSPLLHVDARPIAGSSEHREREQQESEHCRRQNSLEAHRNDAADVRFSVVNSPKRLPEILELRRVAGQEAPAAGSDPEATDPRDQQARFVIAETGGRLVATVRLGLPIPGPIMHHTAELAGPAHRLPPKHDVLEVSRACVHPDYRGQGLLWRLVAEMLKAAQTFERPFLVAGVEARLWSFWRRCGFQKIGINYRRAHSEAEYAVIVLELEEVLAGRGIAPELASHLCTSV